MSVNDPIRLGGPVDLHWAPAGMAGDRLAWRYAGRVDQDLTVTPLDDEIRQRVNEAISARIRDSFAGGIITAVPVTTRPPEPGEIMANMRRLLEHFERPRPTRFECSAEMFLGLHQVAVDRDETIGSLLDGIPVYIDLTMQPREWRLLDQHGNVLRERREEQLPDVDDTLSRIDAAIEEWEQGPDAARWTPPEPADTYNEDPPHVMMGVIIGDRPAGPMRP